MKKKEKLTIEQKKLDADLWIIAIISIAVLGIWMVFQNQLVTIMKDNTVNILLRVLVGAAFQFGIAGLGIVIVAIIRKENLLTYGLKKKGTILSILLCALCFAPNIIFVLGTKQALGYLPFQSVWTTKNLLSSAFPENVVGMLITAVVWGFFEGFNYVVISDKINKRYPSKNQWLNWGAIVCAIICILIHGAIGVTVENMIEMLTIVIIIYGMLIVKERTGNAWGCIAIFVLLWNAF